MPKSKVGPRPTSTAQEDYLRALLTLSEEAVPVPTSQVAERMGVHPASVSEMFTKLADKDLIVHDRYRGATLTRTGSAIALEMTRHHRILETFLVEVLGYRWDEVHEEADRLEHAISEKLEQRMWEAVGRPEFDPHGDPIPEHGGSLAPRADRPLVEAAAGTRVRVSRISDRDPDKLRAIQELGFGPGSRLTVLAESRWESPVDVALVADLAKPRRGTPRTGVTRISIPLGLARATFVETEGDG